MGDIEISEEDLLKMFEFLDEYEYDYEDWEYAEDPIFEVPVTFEILPGG